MAPLPGQSLTHSGDFLKLLFPNNHSNIRVEDEDQGYRLHISGYSGTAGGSLNYHDGLKFSTRDRDNDKWSSNNCSQRSRGGWWFRGYNYQK